MLEQPFAGAERHRRLPEVDGERCVHALIETASCRACVDSCPYGAWILDDERLGINPDACDGCSLCAAACPQEAISRAEPPAALTNRTETPVLLLACDATGADAAPEARIACLHALGLRDLLRLYHGGVRRIAALRGNCEHCPRGSGRRIESDVAALNALLAQRGLTHLEFDVLAPSAWARLINTTHHAPVEPRMSRRHFLRRSLGSGVEFGLQQAHLTPDQPDKFTPPGRWLPKTSAADALPFVPEIDASRCNGCDACPRLCPHAAIRLECVDGGLRYGLDGEQCNGCGICADVCGQDAVTIERGQPQTLMAVELDNHLCRACGAPFHLPAAPGGAQSLCPICTRTQHYRKLYQVLQ